MVFIKRIFQLSIIKGVVFWIVSKNLESIGDLLTDGKQNEWPNFLQNYYFSSQKPFLFFGYAKPILK